MFVDVDSSVEVLATLSGNANAICAVKQGPLLATVFHPEVTEGDYTWHAFFINMIK